MKAWVDGECTLCFLSWEHLDAEKRVVRCNITVMVHTFMHQSNFHTGYKIVHFYWSRSSDSDAYIHLLARPGGDHTGRFQDVVAEQLHICYANGRFEQIFRRFKRHSGYKWFKELLERI